MRLHYFAPWDAAEATVVNGAPPRRQTLVAVCLLFLISAVATVTLFVRGDVLALDSVQSVYARGLIYDSGAPGRPVQAPFEMLETRAAARSSLDVKMRVMADSLGPYPNLFQTAALNDGIRLEASSGGTLALIVGFPDATGYRPLIITTAFAPGVWHDIEIHVTPLQHIQVSYDGVNTVDTLMPGARYLIRDVVVGNGFSKGRPLAGRVADASVGYALYEPVPGRKLLILLLMLVFAATAFASLCMLGFLRRRSSKVIV